MYNLRKAGEPEVKQPEKIATALRNPNATTYKPEILASSKKVEPISSPADVKIDIVDEEEDQENQNNNYGINQSIEGEPQNGVNDNGPERAATNIQRNQL